MPSLTPCKSFTTRRGAALLEITCALFLITTGLFGVLQMYAHALEHTAWQVESDLAETVLSNELETVHAVGFGGLALGEHAAFLSDTRARNRLKGLATRRTVSPTPGVEAFARTVTVSVSWRARTGRTVEKSVTTIVADRGGEQ